MPITQDNVRHIAALARIHLTTGEETELVTHFSTVLAYREKWNTLTIEGGEPTSQAVNLSSASLREDQVTNRNETAALLQNAPARTAEFFSVPKMIE